MIRVNNLDESLKFYCDALGMKLLRRHDFPGGEFTLAFVGYGSEADNAVIELTYNWGKSATIWAMRSAISRSASTTSIRPALSSRRAVSRWCASRDR